MPYHVIVSSPGEPSRRLQFDQAELNIGRANDADICLPKGNVTKRHARVVLVDDRFVVVDLKSTNGTYVNGRRVDVPTVVKPGDQIQVGDFVLVIGGADEAAEPPPAVVVVPPSPADAPTPPRRSPPPYTSAPASIAFDIMRDGALVGRSEFSGCSVVCLGRGSDNDVVLDDPAVASRHAVVTSHAKGLTLDDERGDRALTVDGAAVEGTLDLYPGARIAIGPFTLVVRSREPEP